VVLTLELGEFLFGIIQGFGVLGKMIVGNKFT
jgi:hypothetical protein